MNMSEDSALPCSAPRRPHSNGHTGPDARMRDLSSCVGSNPSPALCQVHTLDNNLPSVPVCSSGRSRRPHT